MSQLIQTKNSDMKPQTEIQQFYLGFIYSVATMREDVRIATTDAELNGKQMQHSWKQNIIQGHCVFVWKMWNIRHLKLNVICDCVNVCGWLSEVGGSDAGGSTS